MGKGKENVINNFTCSTIICFKVILVFGEAINLITRKQFTDMLEILPFCALRPLLIHCNVLFIVATLKDKSENVAQLFRIF